jgi:hypothetical protein
LDVGARGFDDHGDTEALAALDELSQRNSFALGLAAVKLGLGLVDLSLDG